MQINWKFRDGIRHLKDSGKLSLLITLMCHANVRGRCWPSMDLLVKETGWSISELTEAKKWLIEHRAIELVEHSKRVDEECHLPVRQHVYQLTGKFYVDGVLHRYIYTAPSDGVSDDFKVSTSETSPTETSITETKVFTVLEDKPSSSNFDAYGIEKAVADEPTKANAQPSPSTTIYPFPTNMNTGRINVSSIEESLSLDNSEQETTKKDGLTLCLDNELHKCTGTKGLKESDIKKLSKQIEFMYNDVMYKQSPMSMYEKHGDQYLKWIKTVFFPYWKNKMSHTDTGVKLSTSKALELLSGQKSFIDFMDWLKANAPKKTVKTKWTWDRDCEICGGIDGYLPNGKKCSCWAEREIK